MRDVRRLHAYPEPRKSIMYACIGASGGTTQFEAPRLMSLPCRASVAATRAAGSRYWPCAPRWAWYASITKPSDGREPPPIAMRSSLVVPLKVMGRWEVA